MIEVRAAIEVPEGDGLTVRRLMPTPELEHVDPFVLCDHFDISGGGFPPHPHRGFEAITWLFSGGMQHKDNLGNKGVVHAGGAQRFTAGRGITHSEMPDGTAVGIQLWINLPQRLKRIDADYQQAEAAGIPVQDADGVQIRHIVGRRGPIRLHTDVEYLDVRMPAGSAWSRSVPTGWQGFVYVVSGAPEVHGNALGAGKAALVEAENKLGIEAKTEAHLMWCFGCPHHEPVHRHGPFVD